MCIVFSSLPRNQSFGSDNVLAFYQVSLHFVILKLGIAEDGIYILQKICTYQLQNRGLSVLSLYLIRLSVCVLSLVFFTATIQVSVTLFCFVNKSAGFARKSNSNIYSYSTISGIQVLIKSDRTFSQFSLKKVYMQKKPWKVCRCFETTEVTDMFDALKHIFTT